MVIFQLQKNPIDGAASAGFDAVKFQKRTIDKVYSKEYLDSLRESPWGATQRQQKRRVSLEIKNLRLSMFTVKRKNILWSGQHGMDSQNFLRKYNLSFNKLASPMLGSFSFNQ